MVSHVDEFMEQNNPTNLDSYIRKRNGQTMLSYKLHHEWA